MFLHFYWKELHHQLQMIMETHPYILQPSELSHNVQRSFSSGELMPMWRTITLKRHLSYHSLSDYHLKIMKEWKISANLLPWLPLRWDHQSIHNKFVHISNEILNFIFRVRDIFLANPIRKAKINFHEMIKRPSMIVSFKLSMHTAI